MTETLDFTKYFLDLKKVNRFPIAFVVKTSLTPEAALARIEADALKSGKYQPKEVEIYISLFEEVFTLASLREILEKVHADSYETIKADLILNFQLEYGLLD